VPAITCGNPVRSEIAALAAGPSPAPHGRTLLILGGSQGAQTLNQAVLELVRQHRHELADWKIIHQTGPQHAEFVRQAYAELNQTHEVADFFTDLTACYRQAGLVIARAGATTLAELACAGKPMVLVPYPHAADDHQRANAEAFVRQGAAAIVAQQAEAADTASALWRALEPWWYNERLRLRAGDAARSLARPDATARILALLQEASKAAA
jgi:UDP-N-acetylglucosamine--N-acetylmuramyl-(pentapeptide) pyrophosphoryl-undecaprenol N-acetylglucosamine transferase